MERVGARSDTSPRFRRRAARRALGYAAAGTRAVRDAALWVDDVDAVHERCTAEGLEITYPPTNEPWGVREMHVRHPDGHVFRISRALGTD